MCRCLYAVCFVFHHYTVMLDTFDVDGFVWLRIPTENALPIL